MIHITNTISIPEVEVQLEAVRAQGPGGQNVNKVSSAIHLRFDIHGSGLPDRIKERLLQLKDRRISKEGIIVIKSQRSRTQEKNRQDALNRLRTLILKTVGTPKRRKPTRPTKASQKKRLDSKARNKRTKQLRGRVTDSEC